MEEKKVDQQQRQQNKLQSGPTKIEIVFFLRNG